MQNSQWSDEQKGVMTYTLTNQWGALVKTMPTDVFLFTG